MTSVVHKIRKDRGTELGRAKIATEVYEDDDDEENDDDARFEPNTVSLMRNPQRLSSQRAFVV